MPRWWHPHFYRVSPRIWKFPRQDNSRQAADGVWNPMKAVWTPHLIPGYIPLPTPTQIYAQNLSLIYPQCIRVLLPSMTDVSREFSFPRPISSTSFAEEFHRPHCATNCTLPVLIAPVSPTEDKPKSFATIEKVTSRHSSLVINE